MAGFDCASITQSSMQLCNHHRRIIMKKRIIIATVLLLTLLCRSNSFAENPRGAFQLFEQTFDRLEPDDKALEAVWSKGADAGEHDLTEQEMRDLAEWLDTKKEYLKLIDQAIEAGTIEFPPFFAPDGTELEMPNYIHFVTIQKAKFIQARLYFHAKHFDEGVRTLIEVNTLGKMVSAGKRAALIHYLVGARLERDSIRWMQSVMCRSKLSTELLSRLLESIPEAPVNDKVMAKVLSTELNDYILQGGELYADKIISIMKQVVPSMDPKSVIDKEETERNLTSFFNRFIRNTALSWPERDKELTSDIEDVAGGFEEYEEWSLEARCCPPEEFDINNEEHVAHWKKLFDLARSSKNYLGRASMVYIPYCEDYYRSSIIKRTKNNMLRVFIALQIFQNKYSRYPDKLSELVDSEILDRVPLDLFANAPLQYASKEQKVWSVWYDDSDEEYAEENASVLSCDL